MMPSSFSDCLSAAYGTADRLGEILECDMRPSLEKALLAWLKTHGGKPEELRVLDDHFLSFNPDRLPAVLADASADESWKQIRDDFEWIDTLFQLDDPDFPSMNTELIEHLFSLIESRSFLDSPLPAMHPKQILPACETTPPQAKNSDTPATPDAPCVQSDKADTDPKAERTRKDTLEADLKALDGLIGLEDVKREMHDISALLAMNALRKERGLRALPVARHLVFVGNPGTGKTTTARIVAKLYKDLGFLSKGQFVECSRADLVGEYVGATAPKTRKVIQSALGGVLFIDEAYSLARESGKDFGREAIEVLLQEMENHREDLVVIVAGYPENMKDFLLSNPGLRSRFTSFIHFRNYSPEQLLEILTRMAESMDYNLSDQARQSLLARLTQSWSYLPESFANGRSMRTLLEKAATAQARRLMEQPSASTDDLQSLTDEDFTAAFAHNPDWPDPAEIVASSSKIRISKQS